MCMMEGGIGIDGDKRTQEHKRGGKSGELK